MASPRRAGLGLGLLAVSVLTVGIAGSGVAVEALLPTRSVAPQPSVAAALPSAVPATRAPLADFPRYSPLPTPGPVPDLATPKPSASPAASRAPGVAAGPTRRVATRVAVPALGIDLPVMRQKTSYPPCNVAMYLPEFEQPGEGGPVYLYAHARQGMFLPLLDRSLRNDGASMLGMTIHVWTGDNRRFEYEIYRVRRHARNFRPVVRAGGETVWLQTSEGPSASYPKLQVAGRLVGSTEVGHDEAHPRPRPVNC